MDMILTVEKPLSAGITIIKQRKEVVIVLLKKGMKEQLKQPRTVMSYNQKCLNLNWMRQKIL